MTKQQAPSDPQAEAFMSKMEKELHVKFVDATPKEAPSGSDWEKPATQPKHRMYCGHSGLMCLVYHADGVCPDVRDCEACKANRKDCERCNDNGCPACDDTKGSKYNPEPY